MCVLYEHTTGCGWKFKPHFRFLNSDCMYIDSLELRIPKRRKKGRRGKTTLRIALLSFKKTTDEAHSATWDKAVAIDKKQANAMFRTFILRGTKHWKTTGIRQTDDTVSTRKGSPKFPGVQMKSLWEERAKRRQNKREYAGQFSPSCGGITPRLRFQKFKLSTFIHWKLLKRNNLQRVRREVWKQK